MVLRRYTPPTCTLEIKAKESPLSRWAGRPVLKQLRFELCFDDPRQPDEKRLTIWGDRTELEALCDAVTTYVQNFLTQYPGDLIGESHSLLTANSKEENSRSNVQLLTAVNRSHGELQQQDNPEKAIEVVPPNLYLQPRGMLSHDLFLGSLQTEESGPSVPLSALQLFDLANALEEYAAEVVALPQSDRRPIWIAATPPWMKTAALVVFTVGLTIAAIKMLDNPKIVTSPPTPTPTPATPPPVIAAASPTALPTPTLLPSTPTPTSTPSKSLVPGKLPPPVSVNPPAPAPPNPNSPPPLVVPETNATSGSAPPGFRPLTPPTQSNPVRSKTNRSSAQSDATRQTAPAQTPLAQTAAPNSTLSQSPELPPPPRIGNRSRGNDSRKIPSETASTNTASSRGSSAVDSGAIPPQATSDGVPKGRLFDKFPQVQEVRDYLQQRWQPPTELKQALEYHLVLNPNGSIASIVPLTSTSQNYLDRTNMPRLGQPFISPIEGGGTLKVRVVFPPDGGKVEVLPLET